MCSSQAASQLNDNSSWAFPLWRPHNFSYAAPAATALLCLLVISPESLICTFPNLFLNCWHKSEWSRKQRQASESVAFRATHKKVPVFSQAWRGGADRGETVLMTLLSIKKKKKEREKTKSSPGFPLWFCSSVPTSSRKMIGRESVRVWSGFPSHRSRSQLWWVVSGQQDTTVRVRVWGGVVGGGGWTWGHS